MLYNDFISNDASHGIEVSSDIDSDESDDGDLNSLFIPVRTFYPGPQAGDLSFITKRKTKEERRAEETERNRREQLRQHAAQQPSVCRDEKSSGTSRAASTERQHPPGAQMPHSTPDLDSQARGWGTARTSALSLQDQVQGSHSLSRVDSQGSRSSTRRTDRSSSSRSPASLAMRTISQKIKRTK